ncbi:MAG: dephospho-CoA kinase [Actinobacteria bacterium]|nr:dephospho-CoA kinase [Actinomycetota bacterium]
MMANGSGLKEIRERAVIVGLTGGIGAGKSTALRMFQEMGAEVFSADDFVHELYRRPDIKDMVSHKFGDDIFDVNGEIDRRRLLRKAGQYPDGLKWLENLVSPLIAQERVRLMDTSPPGTVVVIESPLLIEGGFQRGYDLVVTIEAPFGVRQKRMSQRFDDKAMQVLEKRRLTTGQRIAAADMHFTNDAGLNELRFFVRMVYDRALTMAGAKTATGASEKASF